MSVLDAIRTAMLEMTNADCIMNLLKFDNELYNVLLHDQKEPLEFQIPVTLKTEVMYTIAAVVDETVTLQNRFCQDEYAVKREEVISRLFGVLISLALKDIIINQDHYKKMVEEVLDKYQGVFEQKTV